MTIGVISDLHLSRKTLSLERALSRLHDVDLLLVVGDIADRAEEAQYTLFLQAAHAWLGSISIWCVSGNHDNPARDDANYRRFEQQLNREYAATRNECGAFYRLLSASVDLVGLNPVYHQKQFFFPDHGQQLAFLEAHLCTSCCPCHLVLCHPPLIAHNPQRTADMPSYIVGEQDRRLQSLLDACGHVVFLSGHTHFAPEIEWDAAHSNLYINTGNICPTTLKGSSAATQQGNVTRLDIANDAISICVTGIHSEKIFADRCLPWQA